VTKKGAPSQILSRGAGYGAAAQLSRLPADHPEGYYVAFANLYALFTRTLERKKDGQNVDEKLAGYPTLEDGIESVAFVEKCVESAHAGNVWTAV
jgi:hypothetical protein